MAIVYVNENAQYVRTVQSYGMNIKSKRTLGFER